VRGQLNRAVAQGLVVVQVTVGVPIVVTGQSALRSGERAAPQRANPPAAPRVTVNRTKPKVTPPPRVPTFSRVPTATEIAKARLFREPLLPVGSAASAAETTELARAIERYHAAGRLEQFAPFLDFLVRHPTSSWRASIQLQMGSLFARTGYFSRALRAWEDAWLLTKDATDPAGRAIAESSVAEWLELAVKLGKIEEAGARLQELEGRDIGGSAGARLRMAREGLWILQHRHNLAFASATLALEMVLRNRNPEPFPLPATLAEYHPMPAGTSLTALRGLARSVGLDWTMAYRAERNATFVVPSVIHLRSGHYSALLRAEGDRYLLRDPILGGDLWVTRDALLDEMSGYALVPEGALQSGWRTVDESEADRVIGHCAPGAPSGEEPCEGDCETGGNDDEDGGDEDFDDPNLSSSNNPCGMAIYAFHPVKGSLLIRDIPLRYSPPRGPSVRFRLSYDHREQLQPQTFAFGNVGPLWTFDWLSYVTEAPVVCPPMGNCTTAHVNVFLRGSGQETFHNPDVNGVYTAHWRSRAALVRVSTSPLRYERRLRNGAVEVFGLPDGGPAGQQRVFLTEVIDPQGQRLEFTYDAQFRLVAVTDAMGQVTTLTYAHATDPLKLTQVTDPFGRSASLAYTETGQLAAITDVIGLTSRFGYGPSDFITTLTTPYGTTTFRHEAATSHAVARMIEATDPLGATEHLEFHLQNNAIAAAEAAAQVPAGFSAYNEHLDYYNTVYWGKRAWGLYAGDLTKATITHWLLASTINSAYSFTAPVPHSRKRPLENRVWYAYPGQSNLRHTGSWIRPTQVGRVLDDGASQVRQATYNDRGAVTSVTDPLGRTTTYSYASNAIDLLEVRQTTGGLNDVLAQLASYTTGHRPQAITDAAGQTTTLTYNAAGQVLTVTNPKQETTTYGYNAAGYLTSVTGPVSGATTTITYDGYGRTRTLTGSDAYTLTIDYDLFDRPTRVTYPDGTYEESTYQRLDLATTRDRLGRVTRLFYDPLRRLTATRDPLGRTVTQEWCGCGALEAVIDPKGNRTRWERDAQSRVTREVRADGSAATYTYGTTTSRVVQRTDAKAQIAHYAYYLDGRLQQVSYSNATIATPSVAVTYDAAYGRLSTMTDGNGTTTYTYVPMGQLGAGAAATVDGPLANDTITYGYDELGRVVSRTLASATTSWAYDALGRLSTLGDPIGTFTYGYDGQTSRVASVTYPNSQTSTYTYLPNTADRRIGEIHHKTPSGATLSRFAYAYDPVGNITTWTQQYEATVRAYDFSYDLADQLKTAVYRTTDPTQTVLKRYGYDYDPVGNRTNEQLNDAPRAWTYDAMNRITGQTGGGALTFAGTVNEPAAVTVQGQPAVVDGSNRFSGRAQIGAGTSTVTLTATDASGNTASAAYEVDVAAATASFSHDANGNLTAQGTKTYEWDAADRLVRVRDGGVEVASFGYDGFSRRVKKTAGGMTRSYVHDGPDILEERVAESVDQRHVHGPAIDNPLATVSGGAAAYYLTDHLGSIVQTTNAAAQVTATRRYDLFGNLLVGGATSGYAFTGREWDAETGLYYYRARYYEPALGRFISADSAGFVDGPNLYAYVLNTPTKYVDPSGHNVLSGAYAGAGVGSLAGPAGTVAGGIVGALGGLIVGQLIWDRLLKPLLTEGADLPGEVDRLDDYPANPDEWTPPEGWVETSAGEHTGGRHRQWKGPNGEWRRWDREGRPEGKERGPHWHDSRRPNEHICPTR
jgi:RHS repeat-associated protein